MTPHLPQTPRLAMAVLAIAAFGWALLPHAAVAFGSSSDDSEPSVSELIDEAEDHIEKWEYEAAIEVLEDALDEDSDNPDVLNYLGYCHRKLGEFDDALEYYLAALDEEPDHRGANEYLGELYLELDDLAKAEERLAVLAEACDSDCDEYDMLATAIAEYKEAHGLS